jgi:DNA-binding NtrC family response regulator
VRDRREDLGILVRSLLRSASLPLEDIRFDLDALRLLLLHDWPLNVRELRQALLVAVDLARGDGRTPVVLFPHHLPPAVREGASRAPSPPEPARELDPEEQGQRERVLALLRLHAGNVTAVARELGLPRTNLQRLMGRLGIGRPDGG